MKPGILNRFASYVLLLLAVTGCATYSQQAKDVRTHLLNGNVQKAHAIVEKEDSSEQEVLASLNKGMLRRMVGDYAGSNAILEKAKRRIEELYGVSVSEQAGALAVNDTLRSYVGDRYEQVLLHAMMALNYIAMNDLDSARVEMLQADVKMREWGEQPEEDPFVRYLSGIIFEAVGETDQALVFYRKAKEVYKSTRDKHGLDVPDILKKDLLRLLKQEGLRNEYFSTLKEFNMTGYRPETIARDKGELIVILHNGLAPVRGENAIMTFSDEVQETLRIALPGYKNPPAPLMRARLVANGSRRFETVENVDALARNALQQDIPIITARALARAVVKHTTQKEAGDRDSLAGLFMTITNIATERADTRSWTTLPQEIQMARQVLPVGQHEIMVEMLTPGGHVVDRMVKTVTIQSDRPAIISQHWTAPLSSVQTAKAVNNGKAVNN